MKLLTKTKLIIIIAIAVLAIGIVATIITVNAIKNKPENVAIISIADTFGSLQSRKEIAPAIKLLKSGSIKFDVGKITDDWEEMLSISSLFSSGSDTVFDGKIEGKLYLSENAIMLDAFKLNIEDIDVDGSAYISQNLIYVNEKEFLGGAYGIDLINLSGQIEDSIFAYSSNSEYSLSNVFNRKKYNDFLENLDNFEDSSQSESTALANDASKLLEALAKDIWDIVVDNVKITEEKKNVRVGGDKIKARVITITATPLDISDIVNDIYEKIFVNGKKIDSFLSKHEDTINKLLESSNIEIEYLYDDFLNVMEDGIDGLCAMIEEEMKDVKIEIVTPKRDSTLLKLTLNLDGDDAIVFDFGKKGVKKTNYISITSDYVEKEIFTYTTKTSKDSFTATVETFEEEVFNFEFDKKNESFTIKIVDNYTTYEIKGGLKIKDGVYTVSLDETTRKFDYYSEKSGYVYSYSRTDIYRFDLNAVIDISDEIPTAPKSYSGLADITDNDIKKWLEKMGKTE